MKVLNVVGMKHGLQRKDQLETNGELPPYKQQHSSESANCTKLFFGTLYE
jgi:hypothetical protein